jgi:competence protein ComEA
MAPSFRLGIVAGIVLAALALAVAHPWSAAAPAPALALATPAPPVATPHAAPGGPRPARAVVYVAGAVVRPGVYTVASDARVTDALGQAGGFARDADRVAVNLAAHVTDGEEIAVPRAGETLALAPATSPTGNAKDRAHPRSGRRRPRTAAAPPSAAIDLNLADAATLETIPGVGPALAERIVAFRAANGPFASVDGLADVSGITPSRLDAIAPSLTVRQP